jgi:hypothetical protein
MKFPAPAFVVAACFALVACGEQTTKAENEAPPAPKTETVAAAEMPKPHAAETFPNCTWGEVKGAGVSMWSYDCRVNGEGYHLVADDAAKAFYVETIRAGETTRTLAAQVFQKDPAAPIDAVLPAVRAASSGPDSAGCVFMVTAREGSPDAIYQLEPTGAAKARVDAAQAKGEGIGDQPCGPMGVQDVGDRHFMALPDDPSKVVFVELGSEVQIYNPETLVAKK